MKNILFVTPTTTFDNGAEISRTSIDDLNDEFFESLNI